MARVSQELDIFWQANKDTENKILLWDTFKAFVRGIFINQKVHFTRLKKNLIVERQEAIVQLEVLHKQIPTWEIKVRLDSEISKLKLLEGTE